MKCAVHVAKIATREIEDTGYSHPNKVKGGTAGAKTRIEALTRNQRVNYSQESCKRTLVLSLVSNISADISEV